MPNDVQMVQPDPSLPKELASFWGKWEGSVGTQSFFLIIEKIDGERATGYIWRSIDSVDWRRFEAKVAKEQGKFTLYTYTRVPGTEDRVRVDFTLKVTTWMYLLLEGLVPDINGSPDLEEGRSCWAISSCLIQLACGKLLGHPLKGTLRFTSQ
jgi:hypothetical protein